MNWLLKIILGFLLVVQPVFSDEHHEEKSYSHAEKDDHEDNEESSVSNVGPDKGVVEASKAKGFKLTQQAIEHLGIQVQALKKEGGSITVPKESLVSVKRDKFFYVLKDGFYRPVKVSVVRSSANQMVVQAEENIDGQIVILGVHFLRNIEIDIFSGEEGGHHH